MIFIGIDSGTQSTKALAIDLESGIILAQEARAYDVIPGLPAGHMEQHPQTWADAVDETVGAVAAQLGERKAEVRGIGVSGQQHGLVVLDAGGEVIRPAKLWCDTSTAAQCEAFSAEFGGHAGLIALAGNPVLPGYTAPKILWIKQNEPDNFARIKTILLPHDYLNWWLTGVARMEYGDASGTALMNLRTREWQGELIDFIDPAVREMLPPLGSSRAVHGALKPELAARWGFGGGVIVSAGGGDNMMGAIGTGNVQPGVVTASLGTSGTLYAAAGSPIIDPEGEIAAFCDSTDQWMPLLCTMNVTVVTEQIRALFGMDLGGFTEAVAGAEPGAGGLMFLPYLNGERTPNLPNGSGVLHGMRTGNLTAANLARAAMEGATLGLAYGMKRFRDLGLELSEIRLTGGGSKSAVWRQMAADAFGVPVVTLATAEGAGLGGAIQAAHAALAADGQPVEYPELCARLAQTDPAGRAEPDAKNADFYAGQLERQVDLTRKLNAAGYL
ncbi:MAG: xylulokinase [Verrucomicrobiales bacterium]